MKEKEAQYPDIKEIIKLLSLGVVLTSALILAPGLGEALRYYSKSRWKQYNRSYLRKNLSRLLDRELVSIKEVNGKSRIVLTEKGEQKALEFSLDDIKIEKRSLDGKWRVVVFDIPNKKKREREMFRQKLRQLGFFPLQESVFLFPYKCEDQIDFLRETLSIRDYVRLMRVERLENEDYYKSKFDLS